MSVIYFHSPSGDARLAGSERAHMGGMVDDMATGLLGIFHHRDTLMELLPAGHYLADLSNSRYSPGLGYWVMDYGNVFRMGFGDALMHYRGHALDSFVLALNTAMRVGNDQLKLAARLHGQCELHCWVDGPNRSWLATIIQQGLESGIFRRSLWQGYPTGWEGVLALLWSRDNEPVVVSYSGTNGFPEPFDADWEGKPAPGGDGDELYEAWEALTAEQRWEAGMRSLRAQDGWLEITPADWEDYHFGDGLSVLDITAHDWRHRLNQALDLEPAVSLVKQ